MALTEGDFGKFKVTVKLDTGPFGGVIEGTKDVIIRKPTKEQKQRQTEVE